MGPEEGRQQLFVERYSDLHGHLFHLASWTDDFPYLFYDNEKRAAGIGVAMLQETSLRLNFTYSLQEVPPDGHWAELINGMWTGLLGQVVRGQKDFIINGMAVVRDRYQAADFTVPYFSDSYSITLKVPPPAPRWQSLVYPFSRWVWMGMGCTLLLLSLVFHLLVRPDSSLIYNNEADVVSTLVWLSRTLLRQPSLRVPKVAGCRPFLVCWGLAALVLSTCYNGNLVAFLTVPKQAHRINFLEELAVSHTKIHMLDYGNFVPGNLWSSRETVLRLLGAKLTLLPNYDQVIQAFDAGAGVLEATQYSHFLFITRKRSKNAYVVEEKLYPSNVGWVFQKGAPYKHIFDRYLSWMSQAGLVEYWRGTVVEDFRRTSGDSPETSSQTVGSQWLQPLALDHLQGAFIVMLLGTIVALLVLAVEVSLYMCREIPAWALSLWLAH
ncbi:glutamate receptor-like [Procambarus clarkii]|uniref:glutamate receptor-like n=1 Tax=Procambarus clarkii TaxID=6728 RepID=UPI0037431B1C